MKKNISSKSLKSIKSATKKTSKCHEPDLFVKFLKRSKFIIFVIIIVSGLIYVVVNITSILNIPYNTTTTIQDQNTSQKLVTISQISSARLSELTSSTDSITQTLPDGKNNPFIDD